MCAIFELQKTVELKTIMSIERKKIFISYSWDNQEHQEWVLNLAKDLMTKFGVDVILDQFELSAGKELTHFMETSITQAEKVLVILTPNYKIKAENRNSGVGFETSIISQEIFSSPISQIKFIPILRIGDVKMSSPTHLKSKIYHKMTEDNEYLTKLYELSKIIYDKALVEKPKLGEVPNFEKNIHTDPIIDIANELQSEEILNDQLNRLIDSSEGAKIFFDEIALIFKSIKEKAEFYASTTYLDFKTLTNDRNYISINCKGYSARLNINDAAGNTAKYNDVSLTFFKGYLNNDNLSYFPGDEPKKLNSKNLKFNFNKMKEIVWSSNNDSVSTEKLINDIFSTIVENLKNDKSKQFR